MVAFKLKCSKSLRFLRVVVVLFFFFFVISLLPLLVIVVVIVHDEEEEEERRKIFIHASSGGGIATSFARPRRLTHERSTSTSYILFSLSPKVLFLCACTFFDAKTCHFVSSLRRYRAIVFIINGIVAHDAREEERYTKLL